MEDEPGLRLSFRENVWVVGVSMTLLHVVGFQFGVML